MRTKNGCWYSNRFLFFHNCNTHKKSAATYWSRLQHRMRGSNSRHLVLETSALPTELILCISWRKDSRKKHLSQIFGGLGEQKKQGANTEANTLLQTINDTNYLTMKVLPYFTPSFERLST